MNRKERRRRGRRAGEGEGEEGEGRGGGRRRKVEDANQKDGFFLFFLLAFHICL